MKHYDIKRLALILALQAEIEGMKSENLTRIQLDLSIAYGNEQFVYMADQLKELANKKDNEL